MSSRLTAMDIEKQEFGRRLRGYDPEEVRLYLRSVAEEVERLNLENGRLLEEIGELAAALRDGTPEEKQGEFADVLAWLTTIANVVGVDLTEAVGKKYGSGCPGCGQFVCRCCDSGKP